LRGVTITTFYILVVPLNTPKQTVSQIVYTVKNFHWYKELVGSEYCWVSRVLFKTTLAVCVSPLFVVY